jgi:hypothetical protein
MLLEKGLKWENPFLFPFSFSPLSLGPAFPSCGPSGTPPLLPRPPRAFPSRGPARRLRPSLASFSPPFFSLVFGPARRLRPSRSPFPGPRKPPRLGPLGWRAAQPPNGSPAPFACARAEQLPSRRRLCAWDPSVSPWSPPVHLLPPTTPRFSLSLSLANRSPQSPAARPEPPPPLIPACGEPLPPLSPSLSPPSPFPRARRRPPRAHGALAPASTRRPRRPRRPALARPPRPSPRLDQPWRPDALARRGESRPPARARSPTSLTRARHGGVRPGLAGAAPGVPGAPCVPALSSAARLRVRRGALARPFGPASPARRPAPPASQALPPARPSRPAPGLGAAAWRARGRPARPARAARPRRARCSRSQRARDLRRGAFTAPARRRVPLAS